jgi:DNA-binding NarL/FixJ family response regulator
MAGLIIKILLVDDHQIIREGLRMLLEQQSDMKVIAEADNGRAAVALARNLLPDVVLIDVAMPGMNGIDATRRIVKAAPSVKVIGLSMYADRHFVVEMINAGASGYVQKCCAGKDIEIAIRTVMTQDKYFCPLSVNELARKNLRTGPQPRIAVSSVLTAREREVLQLLAEGQSTREMAALLQVSVKTIETHRQKISKKLSIDNVAELTKYAIREGLTSLES